MVIRLAKNYSVFDRTQRFIILSSRGCHWAVS